jgi:2-polyprenyl-3-methyl-5-hydroxy-6-metoxy-1,4-benzoquinol methylase
MAQSKQTCPNCGSMPVRLVFAIEGGGRVVACQNCGLQFAEEYPTYEEADSDIYAYEYFSPAIAKNIERERIFTALVGELERIVNGAGRLLDVGAGEGTLLRTAAARGWDAVGTEISSAMVEHVHGESGITMHHGAIEDVALPPGSFDAVVLNHVLEHVKHPRTTLERIAVLLRPGGVARIEVPNVASLSSRLKNVQSRLRLKRDPWKHYSTGHHFWFFTPATLRRTIESAGLHILRLESPARRWGREQLIDQAVNTLYNRNGWGGHIVAHAGLHEEDTA